MKTLIYIFAIFFTFGTVSTSVANATDKKPVKVTKSSKVTTLRSEIVTLIEEDAALEIDRNLILDSLIISSDFITTLIEEQALNEVDSQFEVYKPLQFAALENLAETNAALEINSVLIPLTIDAHALQAFIQANTITELDTMLIN